jgi:DNA-binding MarR family transcriptional regulator
MSTIDASTTPQDLSTYERFSLLRRALHRHASQSLAPLELGVQQAGVLRFLLCKGPSCQADMARCMGYDPAATTKAVDSLLKLSFVERKDDPLDRRRWQLALSPAGQAKARQVQDLLQSLSSEMEACLGPDKGRFTELLDRLLKAFPQLNDTRNS